MSFDLAVAAILHGLYDNFSDGWLGTEIAVLIVFVFIGYVHSGERIGEHLTERSSDHRGQRRRLRIVPA